MTWLRGTITSPQENRAIVLDNADSSDSPTWYHVRYANCDPETAEWHRLRDGEQVVFRASYLGNDKWGASEVMRIEELELKDMTEFLGDLFAVDDILTGLSGQYRLEEPLGRGATGCVWKATACDSHNVIAVKTLAPSPRLVQADKVEDIANRFVREAQVGLDLEQSSIVRYLDYGRHFKAPFICLELCVSSLEETVLPIDLNESVKTISAIVDALEYLHSRDVIHRDIKPANLLIRRDGSVCLGDFGIIRVDDASDRVAAMQELTRTGTMLGSWFYMSPEQRRDPKNAGPSSDVYSLGVTWYQMLQGDPLPFPEQFAARDHVLPMNYHHPINFLILAMLAYDSTKRPSLKAMRRCLRFTRNDYEEDVATLIRVQLQEHHAREIDEQTVARTCRVLREFGFDEARVGAYLKRHGHDTVPPIRDDETGDVDRDYSSKGYVLELADYVSEWLAQGEIARVDGELEQRL